MARISRRRAILLLVLTASLVTAGCADGATAPKEEPEAQLVVTASLAGTPVSTLVVEVTAVDITPPLLFNLTVHQDGTASGTIKISPGSDRTITVRAYDTSGDVTHEGSATIVVRRGQNPAISIVLLPVAGQVPIIVTLGSVTITVEPTSATIAVGATLQLSAKIKAANGDELSGPAEWATLNPTIAGVNASGKATAISVGQVQIVATYAGVGAATTITVQAAAGLFFSSVSTGGNHSCGIASSATYCWGSNGQGQLGAVTAPSLTSATPLLVTGAHAFTALSLGNQHSCGITTDRKVYCWGFNSSGQLGDGTLSERDAPEAVSSTQPFTAVSAGAFHTCAIATDGKTYCWGDNSYGQLGDGTVAGHRVPAAMSGTLSFNTISAGYTHTCGIATDTKTYCWGYNGDGQLGTGATSPAWSTLPVEVFGSQTFTAISAGENHVCALTADGTAYCWGQNALGELGDETLTSKSAPVRVAGTHTFSTIRAASSFTCGITTDGKTYCWGSNVVGQLGDGVFDNGSSTPVAISTSLTFTSLSQGSVANATCSITPAKAAYCWGAGSSGQLGNGAYSKSNVPLSVSTP